MTMTMIRPGGEFWVLIIGYRSEGLPYVSSLVRGQLDA